MPAKSYKIGIILAANTENPKFNGNILDMIATFAKSHVDRIYVVLDSPYESISRFYPVGFKKEHLVHVYQGRKLGTAHALYCAMQVIERQVSFVDDHGFIVIQSSDTEMPDVNSTKRIMKDSTSLFKSNRMVYCLTHAQVSTIISNVHENVLCIYDLDTRISDLRLAFNPVYNSERKSVTRVDPTYSLTNRDNFHRMY